MSNSSRREPTPLLDASRAYRVAVIGAGPGGIITAVRLLEAGIDDFVVLERADGIGGTWRRNRFLGLVCDIKSHFYSFSFAQKPDWSHPFVGQPEILAYLEDVVAEFGIRPYICLETSVEGARWDHDEALWRLTTGSGETVIAETVVASPGMFGALRYPDLEGRDTFEGQSFHTGEWPADPSLSGRRVAIIGSAATAVQLLPEVAKLAGQVYYFQRSPNWVLPKPDDAPFTAEQIEHFTSSPEAVAAFRAELFDMYGVNAPFPNTPETAQREQFGLANISIVEDPEIRAKLTPTTPWGCHRPLFSNDYYPTFNQPHVQLVTDPIECIRPTGLRTADGIERDVDTIIYATGYVTTKFASVIDFVGREGVHLRDAWADAVQAYMGITTSGFPNLFMLYGPNTNGGSLTGMIEYQAEYAVRMIRLLAQEHLAWIDVRRDVMAAYDEQLQIDIENVQVWQGGCSTYYRDAFGRNVTQWPHSMARFRQLTQNPEPLADFETKSRAR